MNLFFSFSFFGERGEVCYKSLYLLHENGKENMWAWIPEMS